MQKATHQGQLDLAGVTISCAVLEDGSRVLVDRTVANALGKKGGGAYWEQKKKGETVLPEYISAAYLRPFIPNDLTQKLESPIRYTNLSGNEALGVDATLLPDICDVWISARDEGSLNESQAVTAEKAYILMKGFATVGITALVDEATGYQYDRERFELQKILSAYVSEEVLKWQKTFDIDFYKQIFRLWGVPFTAQSIKRKPQFIGKLTAKYVYEQLPGGEQLTELLRQKSERRDDGTYKYRFHQSLTPEIGREALKKQIHEVTTLMAVSDTKEQFQELFEKRYSDSFQLSLFEDLDEE